MKLRRVCLGMLALLISATALASSADANFRALYQREWAWRLQQFPTLASSVGNHQYDDRMDDVSARAWQQRLGYWQDVLKQLDAIDPNALSPDDQINYAVYRAQVQNLAADDRLGQWQMPFNSDSAFWSDLAYLPGSQKLETAQDYRNYLKRLGEIPRYFDQQTDDMRIGLKRGFSVPRAVLGGRDKSIASVANLKNPAQSGFYKPFEKMPMAIPAADQSALRAQARQVIRENVIAAYAKLLKFIDDEYIPQARATLAAEAMPDGNAYYAQQIKEYTTLDLSPDQIHQIGLDQVAKIHAQMLDVMKQTGFKGDFPAFLQFLRSDPRFYAQTPEELLDKSAWVAKEVDGQLSKFFDHLPRERFTIKPVPADIAPFYTSGRGGPDVYLVNTYDLKSRALFNMPALTLHESYPGHSLQLELASEMTDQPAFRSNGYISAFGEGWGLYSEFLGNEMGIYQTPYQQFGYLTYQMWRACRLVVDTGIHHLNWTREQAVQYLHDNTALSDHEIDTEVDRYISWPGQADSYELGYLKIRELRAKAENALGTKFDIRHFHDTVLSLGSVPLPALEQRIDRFIAEGGPEPQWPCDCKQDKKSP